MVLGLLLERMFKHPIRKSTQIVPTVQRLHMFRSKTKFGKLVQRMAGNPFEMIRHVKAQQRKESRTAFERKNALAFLQQRFAKK